MKKENRHFLLYSLLLAFVFLAVCSKSSFLYPFNDWYDANDFLTLGKGMLHGLVPYRDLYEQKGPILYAAHALCALIPGPAFLGVYFLEVGALTCFLYHMSKIIRLYLRPAAAYGILPVLCALLLSAESFCQGDSAEELCAALLAVTLYHTLAYFREYQGRPMPYGILLIDGVLAGCILWVKYTLLGFHLAYMAMLFFLCVKDRKLLRGIKSCFVFLGGMAVPTVPVLLYFAGNHALGNLFQVYFYNNIFLYDSEKSAGIASLLLTILLRTGDTFLRNIQFSVFTILGVAGFLLSRRFLSGRGKIVLAAEAILLAFFVYTGSNFPYYGYIFSIFPVLGFVALGSGIGSLLEKLPRKDLLPQTMGGHFPKMLPEALLAIICLVFAYYKSPNTADIGKSPDSLVQYQFAAIINESEQPTLLNYGFLDAGFYTAADVLPTEKYFQIQNISYESFPEMMDAQDACVREQRVEYVVVRGEEVPAFMLKYYTPVQEARQTYEGAHVLYTLLRKK